MFTEKFLHKMPHIKKRTVVIIAGLILIASIGGVFAKYVYYNSGKIQLSAKEFYFTSNLLKEETGKYVLNATATEISFTLGNNADKLRFSQVDITYDISVTTKNGGAVPEVIYANPEHKLLKGAVSETTVTLKNLVKGETYIVTATGNAKYRKVLTAVTLSLPEAASSITPQPITAVASR